MQRSTPARTREAVRRQRAPLKLVEKAGPADESRATTLAAGEKFSEKLAEIFCSKPGPSWDEEPDPAQRRTKHVYQQLLSWSELLEQHSDLHPDDEEGRELLRLLKKPLETLRTRLSSTPARDRRSLLHSVDHGASTVPEFVSETRLPTSRVEELLAGLVAEGVLEKSPDGRANTFAYQGRVSYIYTRAGAPGGDSYSSPARRGSAASSMINLAD